MGLKLHAYGTVIDDIVSVLSPRKRTAVSGIFSMYKPKRNEYFESVKPKLQPEQVAILERGVNEGVPFPELENEEKTHSDIIKSLFQGTEQQTWGEVEYDHAWLKTALSKALESQDDAIFKELMSYFIDGRPVFGRKFPDADILYGYLDVREAQTLNVALSHFKGTTQDEELEKFITALAELLPQAIEKEQGLAISTK